MLSIATVILGHVYVMICRNFILCYSKAKRITVTVALFIHLYSLLMKPTVSTTSYTGTFSISFAISKISALVCVC